MQPERPGRRIYGNMISIYRRPVVTLILGVALALTLSGCQPEEVTSSPFIEGETPLDRAAAFLVSNEAVLGSDAVYPLVYLQRRYGAQWAEGAIARLAQKSRARKQRAPVSISQAPRPPS